MGIVMAAKHRRTKFSLETFADKQEQPRICSVSGKRMYANEREAHATAAHRMAENNARPAQLRTYKCPYCGAWHLTSKDK
jgi:hypothetical protein